MLYTQTQSASVTIDSSVKVKKTLKMSDNSEHKEANKVAVI